MRFVLLALAALAFNCSAQTYPTKPIRLVVPFAPGGSSTIVARSVAAEMEKALGQSIIIENKGGGGGNPAMLDVARADPDGYTLLITHDFVAKEQARWKDVIQRAGIKID